MQEEQTQDQELNPLEVIASEIQDGAELQVFASLTALAIAPTGETDFATGQMKLGYNKEQHKKLFALVMNTWEEMQNSNQVPQSGFNL